MKYFYDQDSETLIAYDPEAGTLRELIHIGDLEEVEEEEPEEERPRVAKPKKQKTGGRALSDEKRQAIIDMSTNGSSTAEIISALGVGSATVSRVRKEAGIGGRRPKA